MYETLTELLSREPFRPFTIVTSSGDRFRVRDAATCLVSRTRAVILDPKKDVITILPLLHVAAIRQNGSRDQR